MERPRWRSCRCPFRADLSIDEDYMRRALALFAFFACVTPRHASAQQALGQKVTLPSGVTVARACDKLVVRGRARCLDRRAQRSRAGFATISRSSRRSIARRVDLRAGDPPRASTYGALLMHNGSLAHQIPVVQSGVRDLDSRIGDALALSSHDADRDRDARGHARLAARARDLRPAHGWLAVRRVARAMPRDAVPRQSGARDAGVVARASAHGDRAAA